MKKYEIHVSACQSYEVEAQTEEEARDKAAEKFIGACSDRMLDLAFEVDNVKE